MASEAVRMLFNEDALVAQIDAQNKALSQMGEGDEAAASIAAKAIIDVATSAG